MNLEATLEQIKAELTRIRELLEAEALQQQQARAWQSPAPNWVGETFIL